MGYLWQGNIVSRQVWLELFMRERDLIPQVLTQLYDHEALFQASEKLARELVGDSSFKMNLMEKIAQQTRYTQREVKDGLEGISNFLQKKNLIEKLKRELKTPTPFRFERNSSGLSVFEAWRPLGVLAHIVSGNSFGLGFLSVIEGLLTGNINILKVSRDEGEASLLLLSQLANLSDNEAIKKRIYGHSFSSEEKDLIRMTLEGADGVAIWGGEEALGGVRELSPKNIRLIDWGPKISFAFIAKDFKYSPEHLVSLAREICEGDQQACSAPQIIYLEEASIEELKKFAVLFSQTLNQVSADTPPLMPSLSEQSEITVVTELIRSHSVMDEGEVIESDTKEWRILRDEKPGIRPSPLFRTVWLKTIKSHQIVSTFRPLRQYLQTVGLLASATRLRDLSTLFFASGVLRIRDLGDMMGGYTGEPHDGVYALERYSRRISVASKTDVSTQSLNGLPGGVAPHLNEKVMQKEDFQKMQISPKDTQLVFKSGGSSGDPKFSVFTYEDYHYQMKFGGDALLAAGLSPQEDKVMNLLYSGGLYGGFLSFFTILESLEVVQYPMAAHQDFEMVGDVILNHHINTLIGMPSYLFQLFEKNRERFKKHKKIKKIFYGGEKLLKAQIDYLKNEFGVELIRSASYASVDAGPLGYQCLSVEGSIHHLHTDLHDFELLNIDSDTPSGSGEISRLIVSCKQRTGQKIIRYDIGDLVREIKGICPCGRTSMRVDLIGRHGDVFKMATSFLNYAKIAQVLDEVIQYKKEFQLIIKSFNELEIILDESEEALLKKDCVAQLKENYHELNEVCEEGLLNIQTRFIHPSAFYRNASSGKLIRIIDNRK